MEKQTVQFGSGRFLLSLNAKGESVAEGRVSGDFGDLGFLSSNDYFGKFPMVAAGWQAKYSNVHFITPQDFLAGLEPIFEYVADEKIHMCGTIHDGNREKRVSAGRLLVKKKMKHWEGMVAWMDYFAIAW